MILTRLRRAAAIDRHEWRFRATCASLRIVDRVHHTVAPSTWDRRHLQATLSAAAPAGTLPALKEQRWHEAHHRLAAHFATRQSAFPLDSASLPELADVIRRTFPSAAHTASIRAAKILGGRLDVLGYRDVVVGAPPDWHADPVNRARAPQRFWTAVPFLSPECGDHKVIWEINRHQHWIALGRSRLLNDDATCYRAFVAQLEHWLEQNPPLVGVNWASMLELALRSLSWIWALHVFAPDACRDSVNDPPWIVDLMLGLDRQLTHVERNLSRYFSPNTHLLGEALALYVAGHALPELSSSSRRVTTGRDILLNEIDRQILGDGGHAELSPHYHRYATDFYLLALLVARGANDPAASRFEETARRMAHFLRSIADDHGSLPLIGDDDGGQMFEVSGRAPWDASPTLATASVIFDEPRLAVGPITEEAVWLCGASAATAASRSASPVRWSSTALPESGYYVIRSARGDHAIFDAGRHGFQNRGHAHADALSLVLTLRGLPLLVDPGTAVYTIDRSLRDRFRSSAMHNTVVIDARSQAEPDGPFHWRSRVDAQPHLWRPGEGFAYVEASHGAYGPVRHTRGLLAIDNFGWVVFDHLLGNGRASVESFWHLHPDWVARVNGSEGHATLEHPSGAHTALATTAEPLQVLEPGHPSGLTLFAPVYGPTVETHVLTAGGVTDLPVSFVTFVPVDSSIPRVVRIREAPVHGLARDQWQTIGVEISYDGGRAKAVSAVQTGTPDSGGAPGTIWGVDGLHTDGRAAAIVEAEGTPPSTVVIAGAKIEIARRQSAIGRDTLEAHHALR